ncbi:MAG: DNA starvation/stationary phase protection protein [Proteobacteria bacterium]|nr:DNA starvation/stationary phase protection protein [Pseudomonadota bacterium]NCA28086.1 DNA starvation/stationary phase protection protein [Pseudomonadota bacterium]
MKNHQTLEALEKVLADSYALMLKTQNYHWNVVGDNFKSLHEMFQLQYEELFGAIDELAERIRSLGSKVDGTFDHFKKYSDIKSGNKDFSAQEMIKDLIFDHEIIVKQLHKSIKISQQEGDESSADIFIQRAKAHEKTIWMLVASV